MAPGGPRRPQEAPGSPRRPQRGETLVAHPGLFLGNENDDSYTLSILEGSKTRAWRPGCPQAAASPQEAPRGRRRSQETPGQFSSIFSV